MSIQITRLVEAVFYFPLPLCNVVSRLRARAVLPYFLIRTRMYVPVLKKDVIGFTKLVQEKSNALKADFVINSLHCYRRMPSLIISFDSGKTDNMRAVIDVMDRSCYQILEKWVTLLPMAEKAALPVTSNVDLQWLTDRASTIWPAGTRQHNN